MLDRHEMLDIGTIDFDKDNPRIKKALEKYRGNINEERIRFALRAAADDSSSVSSYNRLKGSIRANKGISTPITVVQDGERKICIDGNTRLSIYRELHEKGAKGDWSKIQARVLYDARPPDIESIRVTAHLVGAREWPPYEKARYLNHLRHEELMDYDDMINLCGGNKKDIERQIDAYNDMNDYYRNIVDDSAFHIDRFSGFVELQRTNIKEAIFQAGFELKDFGEWIRDGKIFRLESVRRLPAVLSNDEAKKVFLEGGVGSIDDAIKVYEQKQQTERGGKSDAETALQDATLHQLAKILARRILDLPRSEWKSLRDRDYDDADEEIRVLEDLSDQLVDLLKDVRK